MRKTLLLLFAAFATLVTNAHDFEVGGIYYNITSEADKTAEVTFKGDHPLEVEGEYSGSITIPATVTHNGVAYSVTSIGDDAFYVCRSLTTITIPEGVTSISDWAFNGCSNLTAIAIPESVTSIGNSAFSGCSSLTAITIPEGVTSIGEWAFSGCSGLTAVHISSIEAWCKISFDGIFSNPLYYAHNLYLNGEIVTELVIPEGVTSIGNGVFWNCSSLTSISIPKGVTSIGNSAFSDCSGLTAITIPEGVTSIGNYAFHSCSSLTAITIPEGVTSIGDGAFNNCSSLTTITIPEGVTSIGNYAFDNCISLTTITIPEGVTSIGYYAFNGCSRLKQLTLGKELKKIASGAFAGCTALEKVTIYATRPPSIEGTGNAFFSNATYENATLYVPQGCIDKYLVMTGWSGFYTIEEMDNNMVASAQASRIKVQGHQGTLRITGTTEGDDISVYTTDGMLIAQESAEDGETLLTLPTGQVYIVTVADMVVKIGM